MSCTRSHVSYFGVSKRRLRLTPSRLDPLEHELQSAFFRALPRIIGDDALRFFAVPNSAKRGVRLASYMKAEGLRAGVADVLCYAGRSGFNGLAMEFKRASHIVFSDIQEARLRDFARERWLAVGVWELDTALQIAMSYIRHNFFTLNARQGLWDKARRFSEKPGDSLGDAVARFEARKTVKDNRGARGGPTSTGRKPRHQHQGENHAKPDSTSTGEEKEV